MRKTEELELSAKKLLAMFLEISPQGAACSVAPFSSAQQQLHPIEAEQMTGSGLNRLTEFRAGRAVARMALAKLNVQAGAITRSFDRLPIWPNGIVGTIAHASEVAAAAVAAGNKISSIGIDFEPAAGFSDDISEYILGIDENVIENIIFSGKVLNRTLQTFVIKEAGYKAIYPITRRLIDFLDARVESSVSTTNSRGVFGVFRMHIIDELSKKLILNGEIEGNWGFNGQYMCAIGYIPEQI